MKGDNGPIREGFSGSDKLVSASAGAECAAVNKAMRLQGAKSLTELSRDFKFFTPALMYLKVQLGGVDPLQNFLQEYGKLFTPYTLGFDKPVFGGLESRKTGVRWNHMLLAVETEHWLPLMRWAATLSFVDRDLQTIIRIRPMLVSVYDPLYLANTIVIDQATVPKVEVGVFALDTNKGNLWIEDIGSTILNPPRTTTSGTAFRDTSVFADAVLRGDDNPHKRVEEDKIDPSLGLTPSEAWLLAQYGDREPVKGPSGKIDISELPEKEQQEIADLARQYANMQRESK